MRKNQAAWIESRQRWQIKVQKDGVRKTFTSQTAGTRGKAEAERKADRWLEDPVTAENARVGKLLDAYEASLRETKSTSHAKQYSGFIEHHIRPIIGLKRINALTEGDLQDVIDLAHAKHKLAAKTLKDIRGCLSAFVKWCRIHGKTRLYPENLTIPAGAKKSERHVIQPDGLTTLFSVSTSTWRGKSVEDWYIHAYRFAVLTGVRPGELRGLADRADVRGDKVTIRRAINIHDEVTQGKNDNARRTFQLSPRALSEVAAQRAMLRQHGVVSKYLFPDECGDCLNYKNFYRAWGRYCEANEIPHVSLYELRHTYISVNKEMPEGLKKMAVGHSRDMDTEGVYGHAMTGDMEKAAEYTERAFDAVIGGKK